MITDKTIFFDTKQVTTNSKSSLLDIALNHKIDVNHSCGGNGTCGTCRVVIENHQLLPARNIIEQEMADDRTFADNERLACQNYPIDGLKLNIPK